MNVPHARTPGYHLGIGAELVPTPQHDPQPFGIIRRLHLARGAAHLKLHVDAVLAVVPFSKAT